MAPANWGTLQWFCNNPIIIDWANRLIDPWISWQPDHFGTAAYSISRLGMKNVLYHTLSLHENGHGWFIGEPDIIVADEVIYYFSRHSYTATHPWLVRKNFTSTVQTLTTNLHEIQNKANDMRKSQQEIPEYYKRRERFLIISTVVAGVEETSLQGLVHDIKAFSQWNYEVAWVVHLLVEKDLSLAQRQTIQKAKKHNLYIKTSSAAAANKFEIVMEVVPIMNRFDYVLLKDADQTLAGFPWNTFMERKGQAIVSGPLRENMEESLIRYKFHKPRRQWFQLHDGSEWKKPNSFVSAFVNVRPIEIAFIEQYFTLINGSFATSFFSEVLKPTYLKQKSSWGIDMMWCAAAYDYGSENNKACVLVPVISKHTDTRSLTLAISQSTKIDSLRQVETNSSFQAWTSQSQLQREIAGGGLLVKKSMLFMRLFKERCNIIARRLISSKSSFNQIEDCIEHVAQFSRNFFIYSASRPQSCNDSITM